MFKKIELIMLISLISILNTNAQVDMGILNQDSPYNKAGSDQYSATDTEAGPEAPPQQPSDTETGPEAPPQQQPINDFVSPFLLIGALVGGYFFYRINNKSTISE